MAEAWGLVWPGETELFLASNSRAALGDAIERYQVRVVPLTRETAKAKHADELYQVLKDLTGLAKLASAPLNTYAAAVRNADELLKQVELEEENDG